MNTSNVETATSVQSRERPAGERVAWAVYQSPLGPLTLVGAAAGLKALYFPGRAPDLSLASHRPATLCGVIEQLRQYFAGERQHFEIDLDLVGTSFQRGVWQQLLQISYGTTVSYTSLARAIGRLDRIRAVAAAIGQTPVPIIAPCHRVIAADGALTGYTGGLERKAALLELERRASAGLPYKPVSTFRQLALL